MVVGSYLEPFCFLFRLGNIEQMKSLRLKQIGLALCLVASLLVGSVSACSCSHHQQNEVTATSSCHAASHNAAAAESLTGQAGTSIDEDCTCFVNQPSPYIVNKSENKKATDSKDIADAMPAQLEFKASSNAVASPVKSLYSQSSLYSLQLASFKPSRAPPRL